MPFKVLIIEDDPSFQMLLSQMVAEMKNLKLIGMIDNSVNAALQITKFQPDILLLDMEISGLNGLEVLDTLDYQPVTLVISGNPNFKEEAESYGIIDFIEKPIKSRQTILNALQQCIDACQKK